MTSTPLITAAQIAQFKSLTASLNTPKQLDPYVLDAQELDLRPFLGEELYLALMDDFEASPSLGTAIYANLYGGVDYTIQGRRRRHEGVVAVLAHFAYARYVQNSGSHSTKHGLVVKETDFSSPLSEASIARKITQARSAAVVFQDRVELFLDLNASTYPLWRGGAYKRRGALRITAVGGNSRDRRRHPGPGSCGTGGSAPPSSPSGCADDYVDYDYVD